MKRTSEKGCQKCGSGWFNGEYPSEVDINTQKHTILRYCTDCGTLWEEYERFADTIDFEEARLIYNIPAEIEDQLKKLKG